LSLALTLHHNFYLHLEIILSSKSLRTMKRILSALAFAALVSTFATAQSTAAPTAAPAKTSKAAKKAAKAAAAAAATPAPVKVTAVSAPVMENHTPAVTAAPTVVETPVEKAKIGGPVMTFEKTEVDYGTISQGADPLRRFKFKNTGTEPLVIKNARGSCGCTVPSFKKEPIAPGETSEIEVRYDTQRIGDFQKSVTIDTNEGEQPRVLMIKGHVNEKVAEAGVPVNAPSLISAPKQ
jgi:hypothetical protein